MEMKCIVCDRDGITSEMSECPDCRFPFVKRAGWGDDSEYQKYLAETAKEYSDDYKQNVSVGLNVYSHKRNENVLELDEVKEKTLTESIGDIPEGEILWGDEKFARIESDKPIYLTVFVHGPEKKIFTHKVPIEIPKYRDLWQVGVKAEAKLKFRIVIGRPDEYTETEAISMVRRG